MRIGKKQPYSINVADTSKLIFKEVLTTANTEIEISNLDASIDEKYRIIGRVVATTSDSFHIRLNNDSSPQYGHQKTYTNDSGVTTSERLGNRSNFLLSGLSLVSTNDEELRFDGVLYGVGTKSRVLQLTTTVISSTTIKEISIFGGWNEDTDIVDSITLSSTGGANLGVGSFLSLYSME